MILDNLLTFTGTSNGATGGITCDPSGRLIFTEEARSTWDSYKRQVAKEMTHLYGTGSEAENMRFLDARLPDQVDGNVKALPVGGSGGSGISHGRPLRCRPSAAGGAARRGCG